MLDADDRYLKVSEGAVGAMRLGRRFVHGVTDRVILRGPTSGMLAGLNVVDSAGEFVGVVRDTVESSDILDSLIIEDEEGEMLMAVMEDVSLVDEWVELRISGDELASKQ